MRNMAMDKPFARTACRPDDIITLARAKVNGVRIVPRRRRQRYTVYRNHVKGSAVHMHWVNKVVAGANEAKLDGLAHPHVHDIRRRIRMPVYREIVWEAA